MCLPTSRYIPKRNEYIRSLKDMYKNVHNSFSHTSTKPEMTQMAANKKTPKKVAAFLFNGILWGKKMNKVS